MRFSITADFKIDTDLLQFSILQQVGVASAQIRRKKGEVTLILPTNFDFSSHREWLNRVLVEQLRVQCRMILLPKIQEWATKAGHNINRVVFKDVSTRWGSCSSLDNVNFNLWLLLAEERLVDYVICHELAHLAVRNHSRQFYAEVDRILGTPLGTALRLDREMNTFSKNLRAKGRVK